MRRASIIRYTNIKKYCKILWSTALKSLFCSNSKLISMTESFICNAVCERNKLNCITPSGRVALKCIFSLPSISSIMLPEYICNVVPMAAKGKSVQFYSVDADYSINLQNIVDIVSDKPGCCILLASYLGHKLDIDEVLHQIRKVNKTCIVVLDECQNMSSITNLPVLDEHTFVIYSFNNKATFGFLGGAIIQGKGNDTSSWSFTSAPFLDNLHGVEVVLKNGIREVFFALTKRFPSPPDPDISQGKGIYSVSYNHILKVSMAASSLVKDNWEWYNSCIKNNQRIMMKLKEKGQISIVHGVNSLMMPFIPISNNISQLQGKIPLKGRYGGLSDTNKERDICYVLHNSMKTEIIR